PIILGLSRCLYLPTYQGGSTALLSIPTPEIEIQRHPIGLNLDSQLNSGQRHPEGVYELVDTIF
ncbi:hypothetical protein J6590_098742, partial [Homalodisca vitripennis]